MSIPYWVIERCHKPSNVTSTALSACLLHGIEGWDIILKSKYSFSMFYFILHNVSSRSVQYIYYEFSDRKLHIPYPCLNDLIESIPYLQIADFACFVSLLLCFFVRQFVTWKVNVNCC